MRASEDPASTDAAGDTRRGLGLSGKLLLLTIGFIMLAEILVFAPSVANFRLNWLMQRLSSAQLASLAASAAPGRQVPATLKQELLEHAQVKSVALKHENTRELILQQDMPEQIDAHFDLRDTSWPMLISDAFAVYLPRPDRIIRVIGRPGFGNNEESVEVVMGEAPLRAAMIKFGLNILGLSILISVITATLVYLSLNALLVRPIARLTETMVRFKESPEDPARIIRPSARRDEIGTAERELAHMQTQLVETLGQKSRLAALGLAVSKVNHDLRNMLASAQLLSDRLGTVRDETVQRVAPKLVGALDRAIRLCTETLKFGRAQETAPRRTRFPLLPLVEEVGESLNLPHPGGAELRIEMERSLDVDADRDQLFRILSNLLRNAVQAIESDTGGVGTVTVRAAREGAVVIAEIADTGPGIPRMTLAKLFEPFHGSGHRGGTGLGLAIADELIKLHGGAIAHVASERGATFRLTIPDAVIAIGTARRSA